MKSLRIVCDNECISSVINNCIILLFILMNLYFVFDERMNASHVLLLIDVHIWCINLMFIFDVLSWCSYLMNLMIRYKWVIDELPSICCNEWICLVSEWIVIENFWTSILFCCIVTINSFFVLNHDVEQEDDSEISQSSKIWIPFEYLWILCGIFWIGYVWLNCNPLIIMTSLDFIETWS